MFRNIEYTRIPQIMTSICQDVFLEITKYLYYNKDIIRLLSVNKAAHLLKQRDIFVQDVKYNKNLETLSYYNQLKTRYCFDETCRSIPQVFSLQLSEK